MENIMKFMENYDGQPVDVWVSPETADEELFTKATSVREDWRTGNIRVTLPGGDIAELSIRSGRLADDSSPSLRLVKWDGVDIPRNEENCVVL